MSGCDCVYCKSAGKGLVDYPMAVVGMSLLDAEAFLRHHGRSYLIIRQDGMKAPIMPLMIVWNVYLEVVGQHVVAAYHNVPKWDN